MYTPIQYQSYMLRNYNNNISNNNSNFRPISTLSRAGENISRNIVHDMIYNPYYFNNNNNINYTFNNISRNLNNCIENLKSLEKNCQEIKRKFEKIEFITKKLQGKILEIDSIMNRGLYNNNNGTNIDLFNNNYNNNNRPNINIFNNNYNNNGPNINPFNNNYNNNGPNINPFNNNYNNNGPNINPFNNNYNNNNNNRFNNNINNNFHQQERFHFNFNNQNNNNIPTTNREVINRVDVNPTKNNILNSLNENILKDVRNLNGENKKCIICQDEYINNDRVIYLPCIHFFHKNCIKTWLKNRSECPICKFKIDS